MIGSRTLSCPSAQPSMEAPRLLGVVEPTEDGPRVAYLSEEVAVTGDLLASASPARPAEVFRFAATCEASRCTHFDGSRCTLAARIVDRLPAVVDALPVCLIRSTCRWFAQEGRAACLRCPQVVTECAEASPAYVEAATPPERMSTPRGVVSG
jgi:hypothetical protein